VTSILESTAHVIATIAARGDGFIERIKKRPGADLWQVPRANRDDLPLRAIAWLKERRSV
jgi:nucleoside-triphosphatase THEP1